MKKTAKTEGNVFSIVNKIEETHKKDLGLKVPSDYFSKSKADILSKLPSEEKKKGIKRMYFIVPIAAAITILFTLTFLKPNLLPSFNNEIVLDTIEKIKNNNLVEADMLTLTDDISIASLFVEDDKIDAFVDKHIVEDIIYDELNSN
ncbi:hypothetical protein SAMN05444411_102481 [Lutibacter oricola]|uniref:Uncharacterized protein n=1 Tax=Lutibacter oricola TaxID=762486 RepID=A0A1H2XK68_9FLAO|nr:hypothetical protein [Lutibacter oricola]SDW92699.1 hypothetical protein SAMN05444411_102481 [Lutibacter oricola]